MRIGEIWEWKIGFCGIGRFLLILVVFCWVLFICYFESVGIMFINWDLLKLLVKKKSICCFVCFDLVWLYDLIKMLISLDFGLKCLCLVVLVEFLFINFFCWRVVYNFFFCLGLRIESVV